MTFMHRIFKRRHLGKETLCSGNLGTGTFRRQEGQLQQISVFAFLLNLNKHCKLKCKCINCKKRMMQISANDS